MADDRDLGPASAMARQRERLGLVREASTLTRDILIAILILFCVARPDVLRSWLGALGVSKATLFGVELTPGKEKELASDIDALKQQRDAAIFERNTMAKRAEEALLEVQRLKGADPAVSRAIAGIQASTKAAAASANTQISGSQNALVESARRSIDDGGRWAVVYGGDVSVEAAGGEIDWARRNGLNGTIIRRQGVFRSLLLADSPEAADTLLATARRRRADAYVVNMRTWCPRVEDRGGYQECA